MKRDWASVIGPWLAIATVVVGAIFRFAALEEAKQRAIEGLAAAEMRADKLEDRIRAVENSRTIEDRISALTAEVAGLKVQVTGMRDELRERRRKP